MIQESVEEVIFRAREREKNERNARLQALIEETRYESISSLFGRLEGLNVRERRQEESARKLVLS